MDEVQSRRRAPVAEQTRFDVRQLEVPPKQRIVAETNLADRDAVRDSPMRLHLA